MKPVRMMFFLVALAIFTAACGSTDEVADQVTETAEEVVDEVTDDSADESNDDSDEDAMEEETEDAAAESTASGDVEVYLIDALDDKNNYCIDISGGKADQVDGTEDLQAHTCYSYTGEIAADQVFSVEQIEAGSLFMTFFEVCAEASGAEAGAIIGLSDCDGSNELQVFTKSDGDQFTLSLASDSSLCITAGSESRAGGSDIHNIRELSLDACSDDNASLQTWGFRDGV